MSAAPSAEELRWLARARELADRARGMVSPNPLVGAIVARGGAVVGEGWHSGPGRPHAEVEALRAVAGEVAGATVVCTLEPCSHRGRTPPCSDALVRAGVRRVVIGARDPLERARRQGVAVLRAAGIEVAIADGADACACIAQNAPFFTAAATGRPMVTLKLATSLDGRIATAGGESRWITGEPARALVHRWRADHDAVAVGIGTALADDPRLTARDVAGPVRQPLRVVFDSSARLPLAGALATSAGEVPVLVIAGGEAPAERVERLRAAGVEVLVVAGDRGERIEAALTELGRRQVQSLLCEGGAGLAGELLAAGAVDRVIWVIAPILIGGRGAPAGVGDPGTSSLSAAPRLRGMTVERAGEDVILTGRLRPVPGGETCSPD